MPIAICPHPPLLLPELAQGAADDLAELRAACDSAVQWLLSSGPESVMVIGSAAATRQWDSTAGGSFSSFGVDVRTGGGDTVLPLPLTMGAWLLDRAGWSGSRSYVAVTGAEVLDVCGAALLVMGDGTAKRSEDAPGHIDDRAPSYDKTIAEALANGDAETLGRLDLRLAEQLWARGVPALRTLGRSLEAGGLSGVRSARLTYDAAPYGVGYFVAEWDHRPG